MRTKSIHRLSLDAGGRLRVEPVSASEQEYSFIYRDASFVRWDETSRTLYTLPPGVADEVADQFERVKRAVAGEYGDRLIIDAQTIWDVPETIKRELLALREAEGTAQ